MKSKQKVFVGLAALVVILGAVVGIAVSSNSKPEPKPGKVEVAVKPKPKPKPKPASTKCALDNVEKTETAARPLAVMVENFSGIRPQAGLTSACVVVEGLAEGGITRLMLVFGDHGAENIGPVRSARTHFVNLARGWNAVYGHVGGSIYALQAIKDWAVADWDQMGRGSSYERVGWAKAPHNVFTSTAKIRQAAAAYAEAAGMPFGFKFKPVPPVEARPEGNKSVTIDFSYPDYKVEYQYDRAANVYKRFNGGKPHIDANNKQQVAPANVVIVYAPTSPIPGGSGVLDVNLIGSGDMRLLRDGQVIDGTWSKDTPQSPIAFKNSRGQQVNFAPGQTWIEIVKTDTPVTFAQ